MLLANLQFRLARTKRRDDVNRIPYLIDAEAGAFEDLLVAAAVEVGEALRKLNLLAVDGDRTKRRLAVGIFRQILAIHREEPSDPRRAALQITRRPLGLAQMHHIAPR